MPFRRFARAVAAAAIAALLFAAPAARAQYTIPWTNLDAGGPPPQALTGGAFRINATVGQHDAGHLSGGSFTVEGGFWGVPIPRLLAVDPAPVVLPGHLSAARPNPFSSSTEVAFALAHDGPARLGVFDVTGQRVRTLLDGAQAAGTFRVFWDGTGDDGRRLPSGLYFLRLDAGDVHAMQRAVLVH
jgi:hypothetical protein